MIAYVETNPQANYDRTCKTRPMSDVFDLVILGGGSAGYATALRSAQLGQRVALVEADKLGGTCLHRGCIPTKALLQAAATADTVRSAAGFGIGAELTGIDAASILSYSDAVVERQFRGLSGLVKGAGITQITGWGRLSLDPLGVEVDGSIVAGRRVVLATGAAPITLDLPVDGQRVVTSEHALRLAELPTQAVVLGGGVIGLEFASAWASLGVEVTIVEAADRLLASEEPASSIALLRAFKQRGINVQLDSPVSKIEPVDGGVQLTTPQGTITTQLCLVALGRRADPASAGVAGLEVSPDLSTNFAGVYAAGDLVPGPQLAHRGYLHGYYLAELFAHRDGRQANRPTLLPDHLLPRVTYSHPEVVSIGYTTQQASKMGSVTTMEYPLTGNGKAQILAGKGRVRGSMRVVVNESGQICGLHLVGDHVSELIGEANLVVNWQAEAADLTSLAHAHPSLSEAFGEIALALAGKPLHMHP